MAPAPRPFCSTAPRGLRRLRRPSRACPVRPNWQPGSGRAWRRTGVRTDEPQLLEGWPVERRRGFAEGGGTPDTERVELGRSTLSRSARRSTRSAPSEARAARCSARGGGAAARQPDRKVDPRIMEAACAPARLDERRPRRHPPRHPDGPNLSAGGGQLGWQTQQVVEELAELGTQSDRGQITGSHRTRAERSKSVGDGSSANPSSRRPHAQTSGRSRRDTELEVKGRSAVRGSAPKRAKHRRQ